MSSFSLLNILKIYFSDFLGSSWTSSSRGQAASATLSSSRTSNITTVRSVTTNEVNGSNEVNGFSKSSRQASPQKTKTKSENSTISSSNVNDVFMIQKHSRFARKQAKELFSSISPSNSPRPPRKMSKSPNNKKTNSTSRSPGPKQSMKNTFKKESSSATSPMKEVLTSSSASPEKKVSSVSKNSSVSSIDSVVKSPLKKTSTSSNSPEELEKTSKIPAKKSLMKLKTIKKEENVQDEDDDEIELEPRPVPQPRPRVTIRQDKVKDEKASQKQPKRPKSAPTVKKATPVPTVDLRSYSKSLKLLGLDIPSNRTEATKVETQTVEIQTKSPTLRTRIKERTQSVSDLKEIVDSKHYLPKDEYSKIKSKLTNAVFEEWYFNKMKQSEEKKRLEQEKHEEELKEKETKKVELKEKVKEDFQNWLKTKQEQTKKEKKKKENKKEEATQFSRDRLNRLTEDNTNSKFAKIKAAEEEWKEKKAIELKKDQRLKRRLLKKQEQELQQKLQKREEAEKHFMKWKESWSEKQKIKIAEAKQKKLDELETKKNEAKEKKEASETAFKAWLSKKQEDHKKSTGKLKDVNGNDKTQRLEAAKEAYESWLDYVEQREEEERFAEEEKVLRELWRPPWYPAGISEFY